MTGAGSILIVCTGNVCRSPYIERLLAHELSELDIRVASAGTAALVGEDMQPEAAHLLLDEGADPEGFEARLLTPAMVIDADLVIAATREHRRKIVQLAPKGLRYTLALQDLADMVAGADMSLPADAERADGSLVERLVDRVVARRGEVAVRDAQDCGLIDPFRRDQQVWDQLAAQVADALPHVSRAIHQVAPR